MPSAHYACPIVCCPPSPFPAPSISPPSTGPLSLVLLPASTPRHLLSSPVPVYTSSPSSSHSSYHSSHSRSFASYGLQLLLHRSLPLPGATSSSSAPASPPASAASRGRCCSWLLVAADAPDGRPSGGSQELSLLTADLGMSLLLSSEASFAALGAGACDGGRAQRLYGQRRMPSLRQASLRLLTDMPWQGRGQDMSEPVRGRGGSMGAERAREQEAGWGDPHQTSCSDLLRK
eukprot:766204-Hanusia_phi.AAC.1